MTDETGEDVSSSSDPAREALDLRRAGDESLNQHSNQAMAFMTPASMTNTTITAGAEIMEVQTDGQFSWPDDCFSDPTFDWFAWFNQQIAS